jgi:D-alanine-D-alanine ligase
MSDGKIRVAVLYGGRSGEHEVSIRSAESVIAAMNPVRYDVTRIFITQEGRWEPGPILPVPDANPGIDVVFPVLHGTFGEDGTMQGLLELAGLPYVGAGVLASAVAMDKEVTKRLCRERGLPVVDYVVLTRGGLDAETVERALAYPVFVKPANLGSSVGISKARNREQLERALRVAAEFDRKVVVESEIVGREIECSVLGNENPEAAVPCEILPSRDFYDYEDKYLLDQAGTVVPADLPAETTEEVRRLAVECYRAVECEGMARVDFLLEAATARLYINEINTIPGFTSISMYPKMWEAAGVPYSALIDRLIDLALERAAARKATRFSR